MFRRIFQTSEIIGFTAPVRIYSLLGGEQKVVLTPAMLVARGLMVNTMPLTFKQNIKTPDDAMSRVSKAKIIESYGVTQYHSTPFIELLKLLKDRTWPPRTAEWVGGLGVVTVFNVTQIWITALFEWGFRTAAAAFLRPMSWVHEPNASGKKLNPIARVLGTLMSLPFWCVGKAFDLVGDVFSYTRKLLDSATRLCNPVWWVVKALHHDVNRPLPPMKTIAKNFFTSAIQLLPATFVILTGFFTAGVSIPVLEGLAGPLSAVGNAVVVPLGSSLAASITGGIGLGGVVASVSKVFSGMVGGVANYIEKPKEKLESKEKSGSDNRSSFDTNEDDDSSYTFNRRHTAPRFLIEGDSTNTEEENNSTESTVSFPPGSPPTRDIFVDRLPQGRGSQHSDSADKTRSHKNS